MAVTQVCSIHGTVMTLEAVVGGPSYPRRAEWQCPRGHSEPAPGLLPPSTSTQLLVCGILLTLAGLAALTYGIVSGSASATVSSSVI
jgi:hypothetical protein